MTLSRDAQLVDAVEDLVHHQTLAFLQVQFFPATSWSDSTASSHG